VPAAVVIGGRGQCGLAIGRCLRDHGWRVVATASVPVADRTVVPGVEWVDSVGDALDALGGTADAVVHTTAFTAADARSLIAVGDRIGSAVVLSTVSVYSDSVGRSLDTAEDPESFPDWPVPIAEDQPLLPAGVEGYSAQKVAVETILREEAPWPVTIIRPGAIHGPHSRHLREWYFIKRVLDRREVVILPFAGRSVFQPTAVANLAELVRLAVSRPGSRVLNCGDLDPPTVHEISVLVDQAMGWSTERMVVPGPEPAPTVGNHPWAVPRPVIVDMRRAQAELGYRQPNTYAQGLARALEWAVEACAHRDWRDVFTTLTAYPDLFDYPAEDRYLEGCPDRARRRASGAEG